MTLSTDIEPVEQTVLLTSLILLLYSQQFRHKLNENENQFSEIFRKGKLPKN